MTCPIVGLAISADGEFIYFTPLSSHDFYRVETSALRVNPADDNLAFIRAANSVQYLGQVGTSYNVNLNNAHCIPCCRLVVKRMASKATRPGKYTFQVRNTILSTLTTHKRALYHRLCVLRLLLGQIP